MEKNKFTFHNSALDFLSYIVVALLNSLPVNVICENTRTENTRTIKPLLSPFFPKWIYANSFNMENPGKKITLTLNW